MGGVPRLEADAPGLNLSARATPPLYQTPARRRMRGDRSPGRVEPAMAQSLDKAIGAVEDAAP